MSDQPPNTTTDSGRPVPSDEHALTVGQTGPVLLHDYYLNEKLADFVRERVPDRGRRRTTHLDEVRQPLSRKARAMRLYRSRWRMTNP